MKNLTLLINIPSGVEVTPNEDYTKVLHVLSSDETRIMEALHCLSEVESDGSDFNHHFGNMVASAIDGYLEEAER
jgi:hypothetical protein